MFTGAIVSRISGVKERRVGFFMLTRPVSRGNNLEDFVLTAELQDEVVRFIHALNVIAENLDEADVPFFVRYEIL